MFYILYLLQVIADSAHVVHIVYIELYLSFEDTVVGFDGQFTDIHVELAGDDLSYSFSNPMLSIPFIYMVTRNDKSL